jgi:hypothetical protein
MKRYLPVLIIAALVWGYGLFRDNIAPVDVPTGARTPDVEAALRDAYANRRSDLQLEGAGRVTRILRDDTEGSRHQRFIVEVGSGQTVLISHNIDLAPRVEGLRVGDEVTFFGEYEWNPQGGVVHWTHHDPAGRHAGGWIRHGGRTYR